MNQMEVRHYLTFEFTHVDEKFVYVVTEDVKNSVQQELLNSDWDFNGPVIEFEDVAGRKIAVNARYIRRCQALFDAGFFPSKDQDENQPDMMIFMEGMSKPLYYHDIDPEDAALIASVMTQPDPNLQFVSFTDEDGESNLIPADKIMLLESVPYENGLEEEVREEE